MKTYLKNMINSFKLTKNSKKYIIQNEMNYLDYSDMKLKKV